MDKDIIIDEVNVAECEHRNDTHNTLLADGAIKKFSNYCYITNDGCYGVNCYYKQLKRLQAENEENIKRLRELSKEERELREGWHAQCEVIEVLREENKRLQAENKRLQMLSCANCGEQYLSPDGAELYEKNVQLKAENEQLKALCDTYFTCYKAKHNDIEGNLFSYRKALEEIRSYVNTQLDGFGNDVYGITKNQITTITNKINEVLK